MSAERPFKPFEGIQVAADPAKAEIRLSEAACDHDPTLDPIRRDIARWFEIRGTAWIARRHGVKRSLVRKLAREMDKSYLDVPGYVETAKLAHLVGMRPDSAQRYMECSGKKVRRAGGLRRRALVKQADADAFLERCEQRAEVQRLLDEGKLYGANKAAKIIGVHRVTLTRGARLGERLKQAEGEEAEVIRSQLERSVMRHFQGMRIYETWRDRIAFDPYQVEEVRARVAEERRACREAKRVRVSMKELHVELSVPRSTIACFCHREGITGEHIGDGSLKARHFSHEEAGRIRAYFQRRAA